MNDLPTLTSRNLVKLTKERSTLLAEREQLFERMAAFETKLDDLRIRRSDQIERAHRRLIDDAIGDDMQVTDLLEAEDDCSEELAKLEAAAPEALSTLQTRIAGLDSQLAIVNIQLGKETGRTVEEQIIPAKLLEYQRAQDELLRTCLELAAAYRAATAHRSYRVGHSAGPAGELIDLVQNASIHPLLFSVRPEWSERHGIGVDFWSEPAFKAEERRINQMLEEASYGESR